MPGNAAPTEPGESTLEQNALNPADEDGRLKSVEKLMEIDYGSVGRNANLLLNIGVDRRGGVNENDEKRLLEFRAAREAAFRHPRRIVGIEATNVRGGDRRDGP
jgi:alpha-L-fucosidase